VNHGSLKGEHRVTASFFFALALLSLAPAACGPAKDGSEPDAATDGGSEGLDSGRDAGHSDAAQQDAGPRDAGSTDAGRTDAGSADAGSTDAGRTDAGSADAGSTDAGRTDAGQTDQHGFVIRKPVLRKIPCDEPICANPTSSVLDEDYLCTFKHGSINGFLYSQATPVRDLVIAGCKFETVGTWVSVDGHATPVKSSYDPGGNHHNDSITFTYAGQDYRYYHSSFAVGWRACQPMDCIQLLTGEAVDQDGCGPNRSIPIVCVRVAEDGTTPPLVDEYAKCPGDPNAKAGG
jgi:hypothetical protein